MYVQDGNESQFTLKSTNYDEKIDILENRLYYDRIIYLNKNFLELMNFIQLNRLLKIAGSPDFNDWPEVLL